MNKTKTVFTYEFKTLIKKRGFIISSALTFLFILGILVVPQIIQHFHAQREGDSSQGKEAPSLTPYYLEKASDEEGLADFFAGQDNYQAVGSEADLRKMLQDGEAKSGILLDEKGQLTLFIQDHSLTSNPQESLAPLNAWYQDQLLTELGYDAGKVRDILSVDLPVQVEVVGVDSTQSFGLVYGLMMLLYMTVILFGAQVATAIAREKNDRTMEILITSASSKSLINGKVLAYGTASIISMGIFVLAYFVGTGINSYVFKATHTPVAFAGEPWILLVYFLFFFTGLFLYLYLYGALGALVSRVEDVNQAVSPILILFIAGFFLAMMGLMGNTNSLFTISSFIPFFSILTMIVRVSVETVPIFQVTLSYLILLATTLIISRLSMKIYRAGSLHYGSKLSLRKVLKSKL